MLSILSKNNTVANKMFNTLILICLMSTVFIFSCLYSYAAEEEKISSANKCIEDVNAIIEIEGISPETKEKARKLIEDYLECKNIVHSEATQDNKAKIAKCKKILISCGDTELFREKKTDESCQPIMESLDDSLKELRKTCSGAFNNSQGGFKFGVIGSDVTQCIQKFKECQMEIETLSLMNEKGSQNRLREEDQHYSNIGKQCPEISGEVYREGLDGMKESLDRSQDNLKDIQSRILKSGEENKDTKVKEEKNAYAMMYETKNQLGQIEAKISDLERETRDTLVNLRTQITQAASDISLTSKQITTKIMSEANRMKQMRLEAKSRCTAAARQPGVVTMGKGNSGLSSTTSRKHKREVYRTECLIRATDSARDFLIKTQEEVAKLKREKESQKNVMAALLEKYENIVKNLAVSKASLRKSKDEIINNFKVLYEQLNNQYVNSVKQYQTDQYMLQNEALQLQSEINNTYNQIRVLSSKGNKISDNSIYAIVPHAQDYFTKAKNFLGMCCVKDEGGSYENKKLSEKCRIIEKEFESIDDDIDSNQRQEQSRRRERTTS